MDIAQKKVLITGANRGIGLAISKELHKRGAHVFLGMRSPDEFKESESSFANQVNVELVKIDLSSKDTIHSFLKENKVNFDIVINNAGLLTGGLIEEQPIDDIYAMMQVNLCGLIHLTHGLLPQMIERGSGKIVNNSSVSGVMHLPCASTYAAAKTGVVAFTNSIALELKGTGVSTLTLITPGIKTRMFDKISDLYGNHMDVSQLSSITPEEYARKVCDAIEKDKMYFRPGGSVGVALWLSQHIPGLFRKLATIGFSRN